METYSSHLPPALLKRLRGLGKVWRVSAASILRDVLPEALDRWERRRLIDEAKADLRRELAKPTARWTKGDE